MSIRARVSDSFARLSADQLVTMAGGIIAGLADNPAFPSPTVELKPLETAIDDLNAALAAQAIGGTAATAEKNNKQKALIALLRRLKHYVEDNCHNDLAILLSSGLRSMKIADLVSGTTYSSQVRAIGGSTDYSDWSSTRCPSSAGSRSSSAAMSKSVGNIFDGRDRSGLS